MAEIPVLFGLGPFVMAGGEIPADALGIGYLSHMAQITIYLPDDTADKLCQAANAKGQSVSRWIAAQVLGDLEDRWPQGVLEAAGAIPEFPSLEEIRAGHD